MRMNHVHTHNDDARSVFTMFWVRLDWWCCCCCCCFLFTMFVVTLFLACDNTCMHIYSIRMKKHTFRSRRTLAHIHTATHSDTNTWARTQNNALSLTYCFDSHTTAHTDISFVIWLGDVQHGAHFNWKMRLSIWWNGLSSIADSVWRLPENVRKLIIILFQLSFGKIWMLLFWCQSTRDAKVCESLWERTSYTVNEKEVSVYSRAYLRTSLSATSLLRSIHTVILKMFSLVGFFRC